MGKSKIGRQNSLNFQRKTPKSRPRPISRTIPTSKVDATLVEADAEIADCLALVHFVARRSVEVVETWPSRGVGVVYRQFGKWEWIANSSPPQLKFTPSFYIKSGLSGKPSLWVVVPKNIERVVYSEKGLQLTLKTGRSYLEMCESSKSNNLITHKVNSVELNFEFSVGLITTLLERWMPEGTVCGVANIVRMYAFS